MNCGEIRSIEQAIKIAADMQRCWFRGHTKIFGALLPTVHREPFCSARENIEFWAGQRFRLRAPSFASDLPKWDDHISWLLLMQHHNVPTRLLDSTENVLGGSTSPFPTPFPIPRFLTASYGAWTTAS